MATESELTRKLCAKLEAAGASVLPNVAGMRGRSGWPDRFVAYQTGSAWLEFKAVDGKLDPLQRAVIRKLLRNGENVFVARFSDKAGTSVLIEAVGDVSIYDKVVAICKTTRDLLLFISRSGRDSAAQE